MDEIDLMFLKAIKYNDTYVTVIFTRLVITLHFKSTFEIVLIIITFVAYIINNYEKNYLTMFCLGYGI